MPRRSVTSRVPRGKILQASSIQASTMYSTMGSTVQSTPRDALPGHAQGAHAA
jgi:hypothetical protein